MAIIEAVYVCDKCGEKRTYYPVVFHEQWASDKRLCKSCLEAFQRHYYEWCKDKGDPVGTLARPGLYEQLLQGKKKRWNWGFW